jgi:hypothetical protein
VDNRTQLISGEIVQGQALTVWLIRPAADNPESCVIVWPDKPTKVTVRDLPQVIAVACRLLANASTELAAIEAGKRR